MHCCLVCFSFLCWVKFCDCFREVLFLFGRQKKKWSLVTLDRWLSYTVTTVWEFAWADSALAVLNEWPSYRGGRLHRLGCILYMCRINDMVSKISNLQLALIIYIWLLSTKFWYLGNFYVNLLNWRKPF